MSIYVNGKPVETRAVTLSDLCDMLGYGDAKIATALNNAFIAAPLRRETTLATGDKVEIVAPRQGG